MPTVEFPQLTAEDINDGVSRAAAAARRRYPMILHAPGDEFNRVVNFMLPDSYMQPHLHPGDEKIEHIHLLEGRLAVLFFDNKGTVQRVTTLEPGGIQMIEVPAFTWHTYVILADRTITYETMMGRYEPQSWKEMAQWAPAENTAGSLSYLQALKTEAASRPTAG